MVAIVIEFMLLAETTAVVVETGALILFTYLMWFRPLYVVANVGARQAVAR